MATPITFKELLNYSTGKPNATRQEFESAMASRGYKKGDIRKLGRAYERVSGSGNEYILHPEKGFDVYDPTGKHETGSGRVRGNKAGLDLGDLIGLGGDVSLLAGALRNEVKGYKDSQVKKPSEVKPELAVTKSPEPVQKTSSTSSVTTPHGIPAQNKSYPAKAKSGSNSASTSTGELSEYIRAPKSEKKEPKFTTYEDIFGTSSASPGTPGEGEGRGFDWGNLLFGDAYKLFNTENYKDIAAVWNPGQLFSKDAADWSNARQKLMLQKQRATWENEHPGENFNERVVSAPVPNFGLLTPFPKRIPKSRRLPERGTYEYGGKLRPDEFSFGPLKTNALGELLATEEGDILMSAADGGLLPSETDFPTLPTNDLGELLATNEGEILLSAAYGAKLPGYDEGGGLGNFLASTPSVKGKPDLSLLDEDFSPEGSQGERVPTKNLDSEGNLGGKGFDWGGLASGLVKYGGPAAYLAAEQGQIHNLRNYINPTLEAPNLMVGAVRDLPHPDFSLPYRPEMEGSSLAESQANGLARAKFQREGRINWEQNNALNRQQQLNAVIDRINQNTQLKTNAANQTKMIRSGNSMNELGYLLQDRGQTASSLFHNLDVGITSGRITKDRNATLAATHIIESPNSSPEDVAWAKEILGVGRTRKSGGKLGAAKKFKMRKYA